MLYIYKLISLLITMLVLNSFAWSEEKSVHNKVLARVGSEEIYSFEIENFVNKVIPIESAHAKSLNKKVYWDKGLNESINARLLVLYAKKYEKEIYKISEKKSDEMLNVLRKRFKNEDEYTEALINTGITEDKLKKIYMDLNILSSFEDSIKKKGISDKELKSYYDSNKSMFMTGDSVIVLNCLISADARELNQKQMDDRYAVAKKVVELMKKNKFSSAREYCAEKPYPEEDRIYKFSKGYNIEEILKLEKGEVGGPYKNIYGYLVVYVKEKKKSELLPFKEIKKEIESIMLKKKFDEYIKVVLKKAKDENTVVIINDTN